MVIELIQAKRKITMTLKWQKNDYKMTAKSEFSQFFRSSFDVCLVIFRLPWVFFLPTHTDRRRRFPGRLLHRRERSLHLFPYYALIARSLVTRSLRGLHKSPGETRLIATPPANRDDVQWSLITSCRLANRRETERNCDVVVTGVKLPLGNSNGVQTSSASKRQFFSPPTLEKTSWFYRSLSQCEILTLIHERKYIL